MVNEEEQPEIYKEAGSHFGEEVISEGTDLYNSTILANTATTCWVGKVASVSGKDE